MPAAHHLLHAGYVHDDGVASSVSLVLDGAAVIVVDPGMVADTGALEASRARILAEADIVVPGHGESFATGRRSA